MSDEGGEDEWLTLRGEDGKLEEEVWTRALLYIFELKLGSIC